MEKLRRERTWDWDISNKKVHLFTPSLHNYCANAYLRTVALKADLLLMA